MGDDDDGDNSLERLWVPPVENQETILRLACTAHVSFVCTVDIV